MTLNAFILLSLYVVSVFKCILIYHAALSRNNNNVCIVAIAKSMPHADENRGSIVFIRVCLYVCLRVLFFRTIEPKRLKLQLPNLPLG